MAVTLKSNKAWSGSRLGGSRQISGVWGDFEACERRNTLWDTEINAEQRSQTGSPQATPDPKMCFWSLVLKKHSFLSNVGIPFQLLKIFYPNSQTPTNFWKIKRCGNAGLSAYLAAARGAGWRMPPLVISKMPHFPELSSHWGSESVPFQQLTEWLLYQFPKRPVRIWGPELHLSFMHECLWDNQAQDESGCPLIRFSHDLEACTHPKERGHILGWSEV